ncbi:hypothetical protein L9F63_006948, partial [Diploptera punctata]
MNFDVTAPGHILPFHEGTMRKGNNILCCAVNLRVHLSFKEVKKEMFELHLENYKHTVTYSYDDFKTNLLAHLPHPGSNYSWETPELIDINKIMPLVIEFVNSITPTKLQDLIHEFALYDFFLIAACIMCSVNVEFEPFAVFIKSDIPSGIIVDSSSAHSVCIAAAFVHYLRLLALKSGKLNEDISKPTYKSSKISQFISDAFDVNEKYIIFKWSCLSEKLIPRDIYGIGSSISTYGEMIKFTKGVNEFRPSLRPLSHVKVIKILIIDSGVKPNTKLMNKELEEFAKTFPDIMEPISMLQETLSNLAVGFLTDTMDRVEDKKLLELDIGFIMDLDHTLYTAMNLTNPELDDVYNIVTKSGFKGRAYGPGIGGCFVVYLADDSEEQN